MYLFIIIINRNFPSLNKINFGEIELFDEYNIIRYETKERNKDKKWKICQNSLFPSFLTKYIQCILFGKSYYISKENLYKLNSTNKVCEINYHNCEIGKIEFSTSSILI